MFRKEAQSSGAAVAVLSPWPLSPGVADVSLSSGLQRFAADFSDFQTLEGREEALCPRTDEETGGPSLARLSGGLGGP